MRDGPPLGYTVICKRKGPPLGYTVICERVGLPLVTSVLSMRGNLTPGYGATSRDDLSTSRGTSTLCTQGILPR